MYEYCPEGIYYELENVVSFTGKKFENFMNLLFEKSDSFSFIEKRWLDGTNPELEKALEPHKIKQFVTPIWYGYYAVDISFDELPTKKIYMYEANETTKKILLNYIDDLFLCKVENDMHIDPNLSLEDLSFFKGETWVLGTVSHEMIATLYNTDDSFDNLLKEIGNWKEITTTFLRISDFIL